ncbi:MAG: GGDEF domain-containing protein [Selenomonadaceae bacterium]|nr:GGDEF domain-containing protein [Selenomonadaceae bacterium]
MDLVKWRKYGFTIYFGFVAIFYAILIFHIEPFATYSSLFGLIGNLMCFPIFWCGIQAHKGELKKPWKCFTVAAFIYLIAETIYAYLSNIVGEEPVSPSICDIFYFINTCVCYVGLYYYLKLTQKTDLRSISFDMLISMFAAAGILYNFIMLPIISESELSDPLMIISQLYNPVFDFALLIGLLMLYFGADDTKFFTPSNLLMAVAFLICFTLDLLELLAILYKININLIPDPLWSFYYMFLAFASLYPNSETDNKYFKSNYNLSTALGYVRILMPYIFTFLILFLVGFEYNLLHTLYIWAILLVLMLSLRQIFVLIGNKKLMMRIRRNELKLNMQYSELQKLNQQIMHDAEVDFLTQLYNRRRVDKSFEKLKPQEGMEQYLGIMLIDVDFFKHINDTFGHPIGDKVLKKVADSIRSVVREHDIAGRFGGDEFIVLLPDANIAVTEMITKDLVNAIHRNSELRIYGVTLSIGCTSCRTTFEDYNVKSMLKQADEALYKAKENGRNQYVVG